MEQDAVTILIVVCFMAQGCFVMSPVMKLILSKVKRSTGSFFPAASSQILIVDPDRSVQIITVLSQRQKPFYPDDNSKTCPSLAWLVGGASQVKL